MAVKTLNDLFIEQLQDLYNSETQVQGALERWSTAAQTSELKDLFNERLEQANRHINRVQQICNALGVSPTGEKCHGMEGLIEEGDEYVESSAQNAARDAGLIANIQRVQHYGIAGYGCARTYARQLGHDEAAKALQKNVTESADLDERFTQLAESTLNEDALEGAAA